MKIIIEGCDGTGKTTLCKQLAEKYKLDSMHITSKDPNDFAFYQQLIRKENVVYDRNVIGEMIYPKIFDRKQNLTLVDYLYLTEKAIEQGVIILVLTTDSDEIYRRLDERGNEDERIYKNIELIDSQFKHYAGLAGIPVIDTSKLSFEEICKNYIEKGDK